MVKRRINRKREEKKLKAKIAGGILNVKEGNKQRRNVIS